MMSHISYHLEESMSIDNNLIQNYTKLRLHRCVVVEGVRVIAFRNMDHLFTTRVRLQAMDWGDSEAMARVQSKMLKDQGLDQTEANRSALVWASRAAWEIYMCLLYAEIEHYMAVSQRHPHITYEPLDSYLKSHKALIEHLRSVRDILLHPLKEISYYDSLRQFGIEARQTAEDTFLALERLQSLIDEFLESFRGTLLESLCDETVSQPDAATFEYYRRLKERARALMDASTSGESRESKETREKWMHEVEAFDRILDQISGHDVAPGARQVQRVERWERIREILLLPLPKRPYHKSTGSVQTPVDDKLEPFMLLATLATVSRRPADAGQVLPENVVRNRVRIIELLVRSISMCNESYVAIIADYKSEFPNTSIEALFQSDELFEEAMSQVIASELNKNIEQAMVKASPFTVALALLAEPLRIHNREGPSMHNSGCAEIDALSSEASLGVLSRLRNTVFHVPHEGADLFRASEDLFRSSLSHSEYLKIVDGLLGFFIGYRPD